MGLYCSARVGYRQNVWRIMKLLYVIPSFPYPPRKGYELIAYNHIKHFAARRHSVDLISFARADVDYSAGGLAEWCGRIYTVELPAWQSAMNLVLRAPLGEPFQVSFFRSGRMEELVSRQLRTANYEVVIFKTIRMAQYRPEWYTGATVLSMVDPMILSYQRSLSWRAWYTRPVFQAEADRLRWYEPRQAARFDRSLLIAAADLRDYQDFLSGVKSDWDSQGLLNKIKLDWVPHGVDVDIFCPATSTIRQAGMIVITGNMHYVPNVHAVDYFCREIFPLILEQEPLAHLWLVGTRPAAAVGKWSRYKNITVTGFVPDIRPYLNKAMVSVCPVRLNVGTQTKVLEALAMGTPVVTTTAGNYGVGAVSGEHLYVADSVSEFAERVVALLRGEKWAELSKNGRRFVVENFTWEKSMTKIERVFSEVLADTQ